MYPGSTSRPRQLMAEKILQQSRESENALADALVQNSSYTGVSRGVFMSS